MAGMLEGAAIDEGDRSLYDAFIDDSYEPVQLRRLVSRFQSQTAQSYSNVKTVLDLTSCLSYVRKTFSTAISAQITDGVNVVVTFSAALTSPQQTTLTALINAYADPRTGVVDATQVSLYNTTVTSLAAKAVFTGVWEDVSRYTSITVSALSNVASAAGGCSIQFGNVAAQADMSKAYTTASSTHFVTSLHVTGKYFRVTYTNGATLQTSFTLQTLSISQVNTIADASTLVNDTTSALLTRNLNMARTDIGSYTSVKGDEANVLRVRNTNDTCLSVNSASMPITQLDFHYNLNVNATTTTVAASGTVTQASGMATVATAALAASSAIISSRSTGVANNTQLIGIGDADNGLFWGYNGTTFGILVRNATVDLWTAATAFNVDKLAGAGPSAMSIIPTNGNVYTITYDGTGFGTAVFGVASTPVTSTTDVVVAHRIAFGDTPTSTGLRIPNAPLSAQTINSTNASAISVKVAAIAAYRDGSIPAVIGRCRAVDCYETISSTSYVPIMTLLNKSTYQTLNNKTSLLLRSISLSSDGTKGSVILCISDAPTLTGAAYSDISTNTTPAQLDTSSTSYTGGTVLFATCIQCASEVFADVSSYDIAVAPGQWITVGARCTSTDVSNSVAVALTFKEDV
ncbi:hypothetical protein JKP88DRAFT_246901 [Tribonema minus]|uniref:Uncharacterized protein n=1 Tax=Tribonema minus TaxID=303371 RepID=A0A835YZX4_9STRA|nr:hypothetical protein JKP88DRAFT_246901 [Tribonema minus]